MPEIRAPVGSRACDDPVMTTFDDLSEHASENRRMWNEDAVNWVDSGARSWRRQEPVWGQWEIPESELGLLPARMDGMAAIELGCGTGYVSGWMWRRGADVVAVDLSEAQLETARRLAAEHGASIPFIHADAEHVPLGDGTFDFAISEFGAALWCDPRSWLGEARRLLRPGGRLVFLSSHPLLGVCYPVDGSVPATTRLERPYFDLGRLDWRSAVDEPGGIEFIPTTSEWIRIFAATGFRIAGYHELQAPPGADGIPYAVTAEWSKQWPSEHVWILDAV